MLASHLGRGREGSLHDAANGRGPRRDLAAGDAAQHGLDALRQLKECLPEAMSCSWRDGVPTRATHGPPDRLDNWYFGLPGGVIMMIGRSSGPAA